MAEIRWININMGCIETGMALKEQMFFLKININMGCIETKTFAVFRWLLPDKH